MKNIAIAGSMLLAFIISPAHATDPETAMKKGACVACHTKDKKSVGPGLKQIAEKYKGQDVSAKLSEKVRKGGSGVWGAIPMPPNPTSKISDEDLKGVIEYILKQ